MKPFIFSADSHIVEPGDLFKKGLPEHLKERAIIVTKDGDTLTTRAGDQVIYRMRLVEGFTSGDERLGVRNLEGRFVDMEKEGIDGELVFPSMALWTFTLADPELEAAHTRVYNDWAISFFGEHLDKFVPAGVLPVRNFDDTLAEMKRMASIGFTTAMLPSVTPEGVPAYNSEAWDPVFKLAGELGVVFALHTGTGLATVVQERGPGGAVINYTKQATDAMISAMYLVAGGVLDRNPAAKVAFIEAGASWLGALAERMDEVYEAHHVHVRPKLSRKPSEIIRDQVKAAFQHDRECILGREVTGHEAIMWGADYPHHEGTFPNSQAVIKGLFEGVDISEQEKADIIGNTAARFFGLKRPGFERQVKTA